MRVLAETQALFGAQRPDFGQGEILAEPAVDDLAINGLACFSLRKFEGDVGGVRDVVFVADNQFTIARTDQIRLDEVGAHGDRQFVAGPRVFGQVTGSATVADDKRYGLSRAGKSESRHEQSSKKPSTSAC